MGKHEIEGICVAVTGYEEDFLRFANGDTVGACSMVKAAGAHPLEWRTETAFSSGGKIDSRIAQEWEKLREEYRNDTGNEYPSAYRVRIRVEVEALTPAETAAYWKERQAG